MKARERKSSITLPAEEFSLVIKLKRQLKLKSNVAVIRRSLKMLGETFEREALRKQFADAAARVSKTTPVELSDLDHLTAEGLE